MPVSRKNKKNKISPSSVESRARQKTNQIRRKNRKREQEERDFFNMKAREMGLPNIF